MRCENVLGGFIFTALIFATLLACNSDPIASNEVARCTKVYIRVDKAMKREYQRYVPVAQDWAYFASEYGFQDGNTEHVYRYNHNIFINRKKTDVEHKIVTEANYIESCSKNRLRGDTIYLMVDNGDTYSEFLVKEQYDLVTEGESVVNHDFFGESELLVDYSMEQGQWTALDSTMRRIAVKKVSELDCHLIHQVTRYHRLDSINELFIKGIGSMHRRNTELDIRLYLINDMTISVYLDEACK